MSEQNLCWSDTLSDQLEKIIICTGPKGGVGNAGEWERNGSGKGFITDAVPSNIHIVKS